METSTLVHHTKVSRSLPETPNALGGGYFLFYIELSLLRPLNDPTSDFYFTTGVGNSPDFLFSILLGSQLNKIDFHRLLFCFSLNLDSNPTASEVQLRIQNNIPQHVGS